MTQCPLLYISNWFTTLGSNLHFRLFFNNIQVASWRFGHTVLQFQLIFEVSVSFQAVYRFTTHWTNLGFLLSFFCKSWQQFILSVYSIFSPLLLHICRFSFSSFSSPSSLSFFFFLFFSWCHSVPAANTMPSLWRVAWIICWTVTVSFIIHLSTTSSARVIILAVIPLLVSVLQVMSTRSARFLTDFWAILPCSDLNSVRTTVGTVLLPLHSSSEVPKVHMFGVWKGLATIEELATFSVICLTLSAWSGPEILEGISVFPF